MDLVDYLEYADITENWFGQFPLGQTIPGERHWIDEAEEKQGGDPEEVMYYFNEWRYRGHITPGPGIPASFGCSHAMGYGVHRPYAEILEVANLGCSGFSNDAIARLACTYCKEFTPPYIIVLWTIPSRREHITSVGNSKQFRNQHSKDWHMNYIDLQSQKLDEYNLQKNRLLVEMCCRAYNVRLIQFNFDNDNNDKKSRDGIHPGAAWHINMAKEIASNELFMSK